MMMLALVAMPLLNATTPADSGVPLTSFDLDALLVGDCVWHCRKCDNDEHDIVVATTSNAQSIHHETCNPGKCSLHDCEPTFTATASDPNAFPVNGLLELEAAVERSTYAQLAEFVKANPGRVRLNRERGALQLLGCNDAIVASYTRHTTPVIDDLLLQ
jgi:hypothetical protein